MHSNRILWPIRQKDLIIFEDKAEAFYLCPYANVVPIRKSKETFYNKYDDHYFACNKRNIRVTVQDISGEQPYPDSIDSSF